VRAANGLAYHLTPMLDVALLREHPEAIAESMLRRGLDADLTALIGLDEAVRVRKRQAEQTRAEQKEAGKRIANLTGADKEAAIAASANLAEAYKRLTSEVEALESDFQGSWEKVPNLVDPTAAEGHTDAGNLEIKRWSEPVHRDYPVRDHQDLGESLDVIDTDRGAKVSGSRFGYLKGKAVLLEFGLVRFAFDRLVTAGFTPMVPPVLVRDTALHGTGFFPGDREQVYAVEADDLYLVGTSEVPLAAYHAEEILDEEALPVRYAGFSTCFRREAGTYGKDTRGIFRVHQFDKVEMFVFTRPEDAAAEHERLLALEESIVQGLELPYRVVNIAAGDLGSSAAKKYDIEAWFPGQEAYREVTSCSNTTDYQARRLRVRYKGATGNRLVHTLNGTAVAIGRAILAILENHQQADGSVAMPAALRPYLGFDVIAP